MLQFTVYHKADALWAEAQLLRVKAVLAYPGCYGTTQPLKHVGIATENKQLCFWRLVGGVGPF